VQVLIHRWQDAPEKLFIRSHVSIVTTAVENGTVLQFSLLHITYTTLVLVLYIGTNSKYVLEVVCIICLGITLHYSAKILT